MPNPAQNVENTRPKEIDGDSAVDIIYLGWTNPPTKYTKARWYICKMVKTNTDSWSSLYPNGKQEFTFK